ncbi:hypothetical protein AAG906_003239 [Vitis piasezkii]
MWRSLEKQDRGAKQREQSIIQGAKISHDEIQHAKIHIKVCENFCTVNTLLAHECHFAHLKAILHRIKVRKFRTPQSKVRNSFQHAKITVQVEKPKRRKPRAPSPPLWNLIRPLPSILAMAKTREVFRIPILADASTKTTAIEAPPPPAQDSTVPPSEGGTPSQRRYPTRRPPTCAARRQIQEARLATHEEGQVLGS